MGVQTLGEAVVQLKPGSTKQVEEHPSPEAGSPSSHCSPGFKTPLPQFTTGVQTRGDAVQVKPGSIKQILEQPSPESVSPSSHCSPAFKVPLPQTAVQTLGEPTQV